MPELPEVETIRQELLPLVKGKKILSVKVFRSDIIGYPKESEFIKGIKNQKIRDVNRAGKYLLFQLDEDRQLIIHLRLSGRLLLNPPIKRGIAIPYERLRLLLNNRRQLSFVEPRVLGRVYLIKDSKLPKNLNGLATLGLEPIDPNFNSGYLKSKISHRSANIKSLLLDQRITAGVGNIYSDEALFLSGIHPLRSANSLSDNEIKKLASSLRNVIKTGIKSKGTTVSDYLRPDASEGKYQLQAFVFAREGEKCRRCGSIIQKIRIGNRSSRFCPKCQPI